MSQKRNQCVNNAACNRNPLLFVDWFLFFLIAPISIASQILHDGAGLHALSILSFVGILDVTVFDNTTKPTGNT